MRIVTIFSDSRRESSVMEKSISGSTEKLPIQKHFGGFGAGVLAPCLSIDLFSSPIRLHLQPRSTQKALGGRQQSKPAGCVNRSKRF